MFLQGKVCPSPPDVIQHLPCLQTADTYQAQYYFKNQKFMLIQLIVQLFQIFVIICIIYQLNCGHQNNKFVIRTDLQDVSCKYRNNLGYSS